MAPAIGKVAAAEVSKVVVTVAAVPRTARVVEAGVADAVDSLEEEAAIVETVVVNADEVVAVAEARDIEGDKAMVHQHRREASHKSLDIPQYALYPLIPPSSDMCC